MMLKTSSNKFNSSLGLFLFTIRQNIGIIVLTVICMLLVCPGFLMIHINETLDGIGNNGYEFNNVLMAFSVYSTFASAIGVVIYNIINFMYLYSKKSSDVFHAIPLTRTQLLFSRGFAGIVSTAIPLVVGYISLLCITLVYPRVIADLKILAVGIFYNIMIMLIFWAISLIFIVCAGTVFDFVLSFGVVNVALLVLPLIAGVLAEELLLGFTTNGFFHLMKWFSPIYFIYFSLNDFTERAVNYEIAKDSFGKPPLFNSNEFIMLGVGLVLIVGLTLLSAILYNRRNAEKAGNAYAFKFIYVIANVLLSMEVAYGIGMVFSDFELNAIFWIFATFGAFIAAVIFGAVTERGFKTVKKSLIIGGCSAVILATMCTILSTGGFGFEKRVPKIEDIATVEVNAGGRDIDLSFDFECVNDLHQKIVNDDNIPDYKSEWGDKVFVTSVEFKYTLKNGRKIIRDYWQIPIPEFGDELVEICKREDIDSLITKIELEKPRQVQLDAYLYDGYDDTNDYLSFNISRQDFIKLLEIYKTENLKLTSEMLNKQNFVCYSAYWDNNDYNGYDSSFYELYVYDEYIETIREMGKIKEKYAYQNEVLEEK